MDSKLLIGLCLSLLLSSVAISFVTGGAAAELGDSQVFAPVSSNFSDANSTPSYTIDRFFGGNWKLTDLGLVSDTDGRNTVFFITRWSENAKFSNTYRIHNPDGREYDIIVRDTGLFSDTVGVHVSYGGITVRSNQLLGWYPYSVFVPYGMPSGDYDITVVLDEPARTVAVSVNGILIGTAADIPEDSVFSYGNVHYAGISVIGKDFVLLSLDSSGEKLAESGFDVWSFIGALGGVLAWYTSSGVPAVDLLINLIIKIQQFGIIVVIGSLLRGA